MAPEPQAHQEFFFPQRKERYGRSLVGSVLAHALVLVLLMVDFGGSPAWEDQEGAGGPGPAGGGGGGGARSVEYLALPAYQRPERPRQEEQRATRPEDIVVPQLQFNQVEIVERFEIPRETTPLDMGRILGRGAGEGGGLGAGPGSGGGIGSGQGTGTGTGVGPGTGGGDGEVYLPSPRKVVWPPLDGRPRSVQGKEYRIHFWVSASGSVIRVEVRPDVRDGAYRARLIASLHDWEFNPAVRPDGTPVAYEVTVSLAL
jgi:protein TonB